MVIMILHLNFQKKGTCLEVYKIIRPIIFMFDPEISHKITLQGLKIFGALKMKNLDDPILGNTLFERKFSNPFGLAAGFDKNAEVIKGVLNLGFGFTEVGTITPQPQKGNSIPRLFRLNSDAAIINRLGFNNLGYSYAHDKLMKLERCAPIGINLGANRDSLDKVQDYLKGIEKFGHMADYLTVNVSSPNTPGLRDLQNNNALDNLIKLIKVKSTIARIFIKIAPDLSEEGLQDIVNIALKYSIQGLVISNTTIDRNLCLTDPLSSEKGGLSGTPLKDKSTRMLSDIYSVAGKHLTLIGVGGISNGRDAYERIAKGASLLQLYTALVYKGPFLVQELKKELIKMMKDDGISNMQSLIGAAC